VRTGWHACSHVTEERHVNSAGRQASGRQVALPTLEVLLSTDHELIPARNPSLVAMHGSASGGNVRYYPT
jgi:hypothetical protein